MAGLRPPHVPDKPVPVFADGDLSRLERACAGRSFQQRRDAAIIAVFTATGIRLSELAGIRYDSDEPRTLAPHPGWPPAGRRYSSPTAFAKTRYLVSTPRPVPTTMQLPLVEEYDWQPSQPAVKSSTADLTARAYPIRPISWPPRERITGRSGTPYRGPGTVFTGANIRRSVTDSRRR